MIQCHHSKLLMALQISVRIKSFKNKRKMNTYLGSAGMEVCATLPGSVCCRKEDITAWFVMIWKLNKREN